MSNKHEDYDGFLSIHKKKNQKSRIERQRKSAIRHQAQQYIWLGACTVFLALMILLIALFLKGYSGGNKELQELQGCWYYNEYTEYEFDGEGKGRMFYEKGKAFEYSYTVKGNVVYLDFELEYVTDCQYTYIVKGEKLTLIGGKGTAEIDKEYVLTKLHEHGETQK